MKDICFKIADMDPGAIFYPTHTSKRHRPTQPCDDIKAFNWDDGVTYLRFFGRAKVENRDKEVK